MTLAEEYDRKFGSRDKEDKHKYQLPLKSKFMEVYEEDEIARALKEFISIDKDLEGIKQILSLKTDFNLEDCYRLFDIENKGTINFREIEETYQ